MTLIQSSEQLDKADRGAGRREALAALEFYAHADLFMNPTAEMADIVLPVASPFEREALKIGFDVSPEAQSLVQLRQPVVPPCGEARSDTQIVFDLACRLGLGEFFWGGDVEAAYRYQLGPSGITLDELRAAPNGVRVPLKSRYAKHTTVDANGIPRGYRGGSARRHARLSLFRDVFGAWLHAIAGVPGAANRSAGRPDLAARFHPLADEHR